MENTPKVILENITKKYRLYEKGSSRIKDALFPLRKANARDFTALKDINLTAHKGEVIGLVGRNGSGKSTLLKIIAGISAPSSGKVTVNGDIVPLLGLGTGFNQELTGEQNLYYYLVLLGYNKQEIKEIINETTEFVELGRFIKQPLKTYSKGMGTRLSLAVKMFIDPDILLVDEALSGGDDYFKAKSIEKMKELFNSERTIFYVSHSAKNVLDLCNRAILLEDGKICADGKPEEIMALYKKQVEDRRERKRKKIERKKQKNISGSK
ncbi:ABC transporter ATP-binding protein [Lentimicrobium sp. S6]|uniref:ABC transporter ATP-binding protein n=1 Tax=Lentimicrobium sp. S6 TaxID=2735872 RepID=UPI0015520B57|nr:ABC transporter ATP-binding protein [Lentimicrobium sp. S6]NPD47858.1 ABC transporter ATP-binding protein [Lentimicrobium sp. S6]